MSVKYIETLDDISHKVAEYYETADRDELEPIINLALRDFFEQIVNYLNVKKNNYPCINDEFIDNFMKDVGFKSIQ